MRRCPDCRNPWLEILADRDAGRCSRWVSCPNCGTDGPHAADPAAAMLAWDAWVDAGAPEAPPPAPPAPVERRV